ncbi:MAG: ROK family protein [Chloroflexi bacterium]|nr:ROK family protein [Chloroflexota bacterium]
MTSESVKPASNLYMGVDVGGTTVNTAVIDESGRVITKEQIDTLAHQGSEAVLDRICASADALIKRVEAEGRLMAIGVALPGIVHMDRGVSLFLTNFPGNWPEVPVAAFFLQRTGLPTYIMNDARAATWGESRFGAGRGAHNMAMLTLGTGIGGGLVINDDLYFGTRGWAGEIGHITVELHGPRCACGNYGCVEALASGPAISAAAMKAIRQGFATKMRDMVSGDLNLVTPEIVASAAEAGDVVALEIMEQTGHYIGTAIAAVLLIFNPELVVIGGGVAKAGRLLFEPIRRVADIRSSLFIEPMGGAKIVPAELGEDAGAIGAAAWAMRKTRVAGPGPTP